MMDAVHRFEGTVNQVLGDGIMALFGAPIAHEAASLAEALDDPRRLGQVSIFLSHFFRLMRAHDQAIAAGQRALALASASGDVVLQALAHYYLGTAYYEQGNYRRASDCFGQAVASLDGAPRHDLFGQFTLPAVGSRVYLIGCHQALALAEELGMRPLMAHCHLGLGTQYVSIGQRQQARAELTTAIALYRAMEMAFWLPQAEAALAQVGENTPLSP